MARDDHSEIVKQQYALQPPTIGENLPANDQVQSLLAYLLRVRAALPQDEQPGLLRKDAGENVVYYAPAKVNISVSRICYADGQIYKVMQNAGPQFPGADRNNANAPTWADDGTVEKFRYIGGPFAAVELPPVPVPVPVDPPAPPADPAEPDPVVAFLVNALNSLAQSQAILHAQLEAVNVQLKKGFHGTINGGRFIGQLPFDIVAKE